MDIGTVTGSIEFEDNLSSMLDDLDKRIADFGKRTEVSFSRVESAAKSTFEKVGKGLSIGLTAPLVAFGAAAVASSMELSGAMTQIQRSTGATGEELASLNASFKSVWVGVPQSAGEVASVIGVVKTRLKDLNLEGTGLEDLTKKFLDFAEVNRVDVAGSTNMVATLMKALDLDASQVGVTMDKLSMAAQQSGASVMELGQGLISGGMAMSEMGFGFDKALSLFIKFKQVGANINDVTGSLGKAMNELAKQGVTDAATAFETLIGRIKNAPTYMDSFRLATQIFGKEGRKLTEEIRYGTYETGKYIEMLQNAEGTTANMKGPVTLTEQITILRKEISSALEPIGTRLVKALQDMLPAATAAANAISALAEGFSKLPAPVQTVILGVLAIAAAAGPAMLAFEKLGRAILAIGKVSFITTALTAVGAALGELLAMTIAFGAEGFAVTIAGWGTALLAFAVTPVGIAIIAITAIGLAIYGIYKYWDQLKAVAGATWKWITDKTDAAAGAISKAINYLGSTVIGQFIKNLTELNAKIAGWGVLAAGLIIWESLSLVWRGLVDAAKTLGGVVSWLWDKFNGNGVVGKLVIDFGRLRDLIGSGLSLAFRAAADAYHTLFDPLLKRVKWLNDNLPKAPGAAEGAPTAPGAPRMFQPSAVEKPNIDLTPQLGAAGGLVRVLTQAEIATHNVSDASIALAGRVNGLKDAYKPLTAEVQNYIREAKNQDLSDEKILSALKADGFTTTEGQLKVFLKTLKEGGKDVNKFGDDVKSMVGGFRGVDESLKVITASFSVLSSAELMNYDILQRVVPELLKLEAANKTLSPAMLQVIEREREMRLAMLEIGAATLGQKNVTLDYIAAQKELGMSEADIARQYGVSVEALQKYQVELTKTAAHAAEQAAVRLRELTAMASNENAALAQMAAAETGYADAIRQQTMTTTQYQIDQIDRVLEEQLRVLDTTLEADQRTATAMIGIADMKKDVILKQLSAEEAARIEFSNKTKRLSMNAADQAMFDIELEWQAYVKDLQAREGLDVATYNRMLQNAREYYDKLREIANRNKVFDAAIAKLDEFGAAFQQLAQIAGSSFDGIAKHVGTAISQTGLLLKAVKTLNEMLIKMGGSFKGFSAKTQAGIVAASAGYVAGSAVVGASGTRSGTKGVLGGAAAGAAAGAAYGSVVPGLGTGVGAVIGGIAGAVGGYLAARKAAKAMKEANVEATKSIIDMQKQLTSQYGTMTQISALGKQVGVDLVGAWGDRSQAGLINFQALTTEFQRRVEALTQAVQEFGLTWEDLDTERQIAFLADEAEKLALKIEMATKAGYKFDSVVGGASGQLNNLLAAAIATGNKIPAALGPAIRKMVELGQITDANASALLGLAASTMPSLADITDAAGRYGLKLDQLGPKVRQLSINESAAQIIKDFKLLEAAGADFLTILGPITAAEKAVIDLNYKGADVAAKGTPLWQEYQDAVKKWKDEVKEAGGSVDNMRTQIQKLVTSAFDMGLEIPAAMKPLVERMVTAGLLTDNLGVKLTDTSKLKFATDLSTMFETLISKLDDLIEKLVDGVGGALNGIGGIVVSPTIRPKYDPSDLPGPFNPDPVEPQQFAAGGYVPSYAPKVNWTPRGRDTVPALLTPGEIVLNASQQSSVANGLRSTAAGPEQTIIVEMDSKQVAKANAKGKARLRVKVGR